MTGRNTVGMIGAALFGGVAALCPVWAATSALRHFDIPAEDAGKSIPEFARQAGRQIIAPGDQLRGVRTPALKGTLDIAAALAILIRDSKLEVVSDDGRTIILAVRGEAIQPEARETYESVVVTGYRASLADSTNAKRYGIGFSDSIFAEDTGKFPDTNIAESFNRIPGITIVRELDGSGVNVSIRGMDSNFTKVLLNGAQIAVASTGPTNYSNPNREVDLNIFPVELFHQLTVTKSARARQIEGGAAGTLDMRSVRAFDNPGLHVAYSLKGTDLTAQNAVSPNGSIIISDTLGQFGILAGVTGNSTRFFTTGIETVGWTTPNLSTSGPVIQCAPAATCGSLGGGNWTIPTAVPANVTTGGLVPGQMIDQAKLLALNPGLSISQIDNMLVPRLPRPFLEKGARSRYNGVLSLEYRPSDELYLYVDMLGAAIGNTFDRQDINWMVRNGAAIPVDVVVDAQGVVRRGTFANAQWFLEDRPYRERGDFVGVNPGVEWHVADLLKLSLRVNASRSHFLRDVPSILVASAPSAGNGAGVPGIAPPAGGVVVYYENDGVMPELRTNINLNDPASFQWSGGRVNANAEKRYTFTNGLHFDASYGDETFEISAGIAFDEANRRTLGYDNSQAWQNAVCGNNPNVFVPTPNSEPPCQGLNLAGNAAAVNAVTPGYPAYPGLGTGSSAGSPPLAYQGSLIAQTSLSTYLTPGPFGFVVLKRSRFLADSHYAQFAYPNAPEATTTNLGVTTGVIDEKNYGAYVEANGSIPLAQRTLRYNAGLRWVETLQTVTGPVIQGDARNTATYPLDGGRYPNVGANSTTKNSYRVLLPSLNLVYEVADDFQVRAAVSRTMTRPNPSSLLPGINFSDQSASNAMLGNGALKPYFANNIDIGGEYFTGGEGYIGIALFRKNASGFTVTQTSLEPFASLAPYGIVYGTLNPTQKDAIDSRGGPASAMVSISQDVNSKGILTINGLELNYVQLLDFVLEPYGLKGFGVAANLTIVDQGASGAAPQVATGISPYTYNVTGYYEDNDLSVRLSYVFNDRQVRSGTNQNGLCFPNLASRNCPAGAFIYNNAYAQLDLGSSFKLSRLLGDIASDPQITFDVQNLTKSKLRSYFQYPQAPYANYSPGTTYIFGLRGSF